MDLCYYLFAASAGVTIGVLDLAVNDLLFTALLVLSACMVLGMLRPRWPWRWVVAVVIFIPLTEWFAYLLRTVKPTNGQIWGSFLVALPGVAGAYGGAVARLALDELRPRK